VIYQLIGASNISISSSGFKRSLKESDSSNADLDGELAKVLVQYGEKVVTKQMDKVREIGAHGRRMYLQTNVCFDARGQTLKVQWCCRMRMVCDAVQIGGQSLGTGSL